MTKNLTKQTIRERENMKFLRLMAEKKKAEAQKQLLTGLCLLLATALGIVLIMI
jgi:hypothetical protein